ncbi:MAG: ketoacyl-ACP synthase III [Calditrichaeota bacterium]|nr:MAG: ketoacyl-ACP synthase III [Calditrichota bacterium]MBL1206039.1 ketoacyl-ACP synthase III [Calditrichota bacterium]NOG45867.1 ketoacyl-ACP synthase III [Calditrichota bacterium]
MAAPERVIKNSYFDKLLGEDVSTWLEENLTIKERRWLGENESTIDLCENAANSVIAKSGINVTDLDLIIISTDTPEFISPSTSSVLQHRLGAAKAGTFDINTACAGFVTALDVGAKYIRADENYNNVLVIGAYAMSKFLNKTDKKTVTLFADGAGAVLLQSTTEEKGFLGSLLHTEGQYNGWMGIYGGGSAKPISPDVVDNKDHLLKFVKKFPKEINPETWSKMISDLSNRIGTSVSDINNIFFTQININSIRETMGKLDLPMNKTHMVMDRFAYTGSACIPMALSDANDNGKLKSNDLVFFMGSGGGLAFACAAFRW